MIAILIPSLAGSARYVLRASTARPVVLHCSVNKKRKAGVTVGTRNDERCRFDDSLDNSDGDEVREGGERGKT